MMQVYEMFISRDRNFKSILVLLFLIFYFFFIDDKYDSDLKKNGNFMFWRRHTHPNGVSDTSQNVKEKPK